MIYTKLYLIVGNIKINHRAGGLSHIGFSQEVVAPNINSALDKIRDHYVEKNGAGTIVDVYSIEQKTEVLSD